jgi:transglutaminase-like putative cysteine protease
VAILTVRHITTYRYRQPVAFGEHWMMLRPRDSHDQSVLEARLQITPEPADLRWQQDEFGNHVAVARFTGSANALCFDSTIRLDHCAADIAKSDIAKYARIYPFVYDARDLTDISGFTEPQYADPRHELDAWVARFLRRSEQTCTWTLLGDLTRAIKQSFTYVPRHEKGIQDPLHTLAIGSGTCRDLAVFMIEAVRSLGLAARFVSGYLQVADANEDLTTGGGNTHAWAQVYLPGPGWVDFDAASGNVGNRGLVRVAVVRDPDQAIPLHGTWTGRASDNLGMAVEVRVQSGAGMVPDGTISGCSA